jgi:2-desacetyl-2-hydroxyethyl bacteriochlorophyllide A dehydrogenase
VRAAVIDTGSVSVQTVKDPTPGPREVVVQVAACGICGTDLHIADGEFAPTLPVTPGHEFAGTVVAIGTAVVPALDGVAEGTRVAVDPSLPCGECHFCRLGRGNLCDRWAAIGVSTSGGAAEYAVAPVRNCVPVADGLRLEDAALIEPLSCALRGYDVLPRRMGEHYLVYGAGTMGLLMLQLANLAGAASVSVIDVNLARLSTALALGADAAAIDGAEFDRGAGWEVVIDCTGVVPAIEDGLSRVRKGGSFLQFGVASESATARWSPFRTYNQEITMLGSMAVLHSFERAAELLAAGVVDAPRMITHRLPLERYPDAMAAFRSGEGLKTQVLPST